MEIIGTIIHGALGDCYEQLCAIKMLRKGESKCRWVGFFAVKERLDAMMHFDLDMLDNVHMATDIAREPVDKFYQFQINDKELRDDIIDKLPDDIKLKFDFNNIVLPWHVIRKYNYKNGGLALNLSAEGYDYYIKCCTSNMVSDQLFNDKFTVGYLWRYRNPGGAINPLFQRSKEWILSSKSELFTYLIHNYNAHIIVAGMGRDESVVIDNEVKQAGVVKGEIKSKFTNSKLDIPDGSCTYLKGLGFAAEMQIMSRCNLLLMMPSGFSEPLWMMRKMPVVLMDPPPIYMLKLLWNKMPLFDNNRFSHAIFNLMVPHTKRNVLKYLLKYNMLSEAW